MPSRGSHAPARKKRRASAPLKVCVTRDGVLSITLGIDTLAHAALASPFADQMTDERTGRPGRVMPGEVYVVTDKRGFAGEIMAALTDEAEDGSSLLTNVIDAAVRKAIEDGAEYFIAKDDLEEERT